MQKGFYTFLALTILYLVFRIAFEEIVVKRIRESKTRYSFRKTVSILYLAMFVAIIIKTWVANTHTLLVSYGLVGAGIAVALQDFFKNFVGGIIPFVTGIYRVGDRTEVNSKYGDVIDIHILYTTLMEMKEWVAGDIVFVEQSSLKVQNASDNVLGNPASPCGNHLSCLLYSAGSA